MKYIRTKVEIINVEYEWEYASCGGITIYKENENLYIADDDIIKTADTVEELIQIGDIVFCWSSSDDKEHCYLITCDTELTIIRNEPITKLLIPVGEDYKCIAKGYSSFNLIKNKRYLVNKGKLELL